MSCSYLLRYGFAWVRLAGQLLVITLLLGADDSYLREIENEVKRQATTLVIDQSPSTPAVAETALDRLTSGLDPVAFEQTLRRSLPGTYTLYERLNPSGKQQVYQSYRSDNRLASISANVTRLLGINP